ncbi:hypothetical protein DX927_09030 [Bacillus swezeyi]|uniref:Uncharacterized protein n=1 Tax=Bacillus swezeyi TaxID=1925020 RepID=A0A5M8RQZ5_9BACI|nr:hypothetical protein DX927_09030 [Bacillus swezeyi]
MGVIGFVSFLIIIFILAYFSSNPPTKLQAWLHVRVSGVSPLRYFVDDEYRKAVDHFRKDKKL